MIHMQDVKVLQSVPPAAIVDDASYAFAEIDTIDFDYATILISLGATDIAMTALKVQESDVSATGLVDVTGLIFGTSNGIDGVASTLPSAGDDNTVFIFDIDLRNRKRFLDVVATIGDGTAGAFLSALTILSRASNVVNTAAERGAGQVLRV